MIFAISYLDILNLRSHLISSKSVSPTLKSENVKMYIQKINYVTRPVTRLKKNTTRLEKNPTRLSEEALISVCKVTIHT